MRIHSLFISQLVDATADNDLEKCRKILQCAYAAETHEVYDHTKDGLEIAFARSDQDRPVEQLSGDEISQDGDRIAALEESILSFRDLIFKFGNVAVSTETLALAHYLSQINVRMMATLKLCLQIHQYELLHRANLEQQTKTKGGDGAGTTANG